MSWIHQNGGLPLLAVATSALAVAAFAWAWVHRMRAGVAESRRQALTDDLTGLGNRRRLLIDLERAIAEGTDHSPAVFAMFDLDGFKSYNDTHGHPAGDTLLARLGARLAATQRLRLPAGRRRVLPDRARIPRRARGRRSAGARGADRGARGDPVVLRVRPPAARGPRRLVGAADRRSAHVRPEGRPPRVRRSARPATCSWRCSTSMRPSCARTPTGWATWRRRSPSSSASSGRRSRTSCSPPTCTTSARSIIPRTILHKPGPLDASEWEIIRQHTLTGEAILNAAPGARGVAAHRALDPRAGRRRRVPRRPGRRRDPARRADHRGLRRVRRHDQRPRLPDGDDREAALGRAGETSGTQFDPIVVAAARTVLEHPAARRPAGARRPAPRTPDLSPVGPHPGPARRDPAGAREGRPRAPARRDRGDRRASARPGDGGRSTCTGRSGTTSSCRASTAATRPARRCSARRTRASGSSASWRRSSTAAART